MLYDFGGKIRTHAIIKLLLAITVCSGQLACPALSQEPGAHSVHTEMAEGGFGQRHPKLRKYLTAAGIGALTGGLGGLVLGGSIAGHAAAGAGIRSGLTAAKDSRMFKRHKHHEQMAAKKVDAASESRQGHTVDRYE